LKPASGLGGEILVDLDTVDLATQARETGGHVSAAGADLQDPVLGSDLQFLQHPAFQFRLHHHLPVSERNPEIREREVAPGGGDKVLARHRGNRVQHLLIQHVPGTDLLLDHVDSRLVQVKFHSYVPSGRYGNR
jgi:hypothetical protein